jgi:hypothetical protein
MGEVMLAVEDAVAPVLAVAVTTHEPGTRGAVYRPADVIVPQLAEKVAAVLDVNC